MSIKISNQRYEEIKCIVVRMFVKYDVSCVPINGFEIAHKMGIKVIPYSAIAPNQCWLLIKKSEDGFSVEKANGQWYIFTKSAILFWITLRIVNWQKRKSNSLPNMHLHHPF